MRNPGKSRDLLQEHDPLDLTHSIRQLQVPPDSGADADTSDRRGTALIVCRDSAARKWGPRWLSQVSLEASIHTDPMTALTAARSHPPDVIIVDGGIKDKAGVPLFTQVQDAADVLAPVIVLCNNSKELAVALEAGVFDVVRKPVEWQLVSRRARQAADEKARGEELRQAHDRLSQALSVADNARQQLRSREAFDPVTALPNRAKFMDLLRRCISAVDRDGNSLAAFVIGFSRFRLIVEAMGQERADLLLAEIGSVLNECLRDAGSVQSQTKGLRTTVAASIDSARFGLMLTCSADGGALTVLQQKLIDRLSRPVQVAGQTVYLSACIGVALYPQDAGSADSLLQRADNAMRDAQSRGGGFKFYCAETDAAAARKLRLEHMLHEAFDRGELTLAYQPLTETVSGRITSAEALLRWQQPDDTFVAPMEFVPIAEESGLMIPIGEYVLDQACRQFKAWQFEGLTLSNICVNVSKCQLMSGSFPDTVRSVLERYELEPACLDLELSERGVLSGDYEVIQQLHELKSLGVRLSIDDFGTGDSAMAYLKELPIDVMKIDQSYISGLAQNDKDTAITSAMVALGQRLKLKVVAEGVETAEQLEILKELGCDEYQGFYLSEAVPGGDFARLMESRD